MHSINALTFHLLSPEDQAAFRAENPPPVRPKPDKPAKKRRVRSCVDLDDELRLEEIAAKGLDTNKRWFRCTAGHGQHCCVK